MEEVATRNFLKGIRVSLEHCSTITSVQNKPYMVIFKSLRIASKCTCIKPILLHYKDAQYGGRETINARNVYAVGRSEDILKILQNESVLITKFFLPLPRMFRMVILSFHILISEFCKRLISFFFPQKKNKLPGIRKRRDSENTSNNFYVVSLGLDTSVLLQTKISHVTSEINGVFLYCHQEDNIN